MYSLKNFKANETLSEETLCFSATVYRDGKKIGLVKNHGHGGENIFHAPQEEQDKLSAHCLTFPSETFHGVEMYMDSDLFFSTLAEKYCTRQWLKRQCRKHTLVKLPSHGDGQYIAYKGKPSVVLLGMIEAKHGATEYEIMNDTLSTPIEM